MVAKNIQIYGVRITGKCIFKSKNCNWTFLPPQAKLFLSSLPSSPGRGSRGELKITIIMLQQKGDSYNTQFF